jgi:hypothetical protein
MIKKLLPILCAIILPVAVPCEAQEQQDSLVVLVEKVQQLETQLEQVTDLVIRLEARLQLQEQKTLGSMPSGSHSHRPVEISNFDNEVIRIVRARCSLSQFGSTLTLTCR